MVERRPSRWLALAIACACAKDPPPPAQQDPIVAIGAALHGADTAGPLVTVTIALRGADVVTVERQLLVPLEHAAAQTPGVASLAGVALPGRARLTVTFEASSDPYAAISALRDAMPTSMLPSEADPPVIERIDRDAVPIFAMYADAATAEGRAPDGETAIEKLGYAVMREPGVTKARWCGVMHDTLVVEVDVAKLAALELGIDRVIDAVDASNSAVLRPVELAQVADAQIDTVRVRDVATLHSERREGTCTMVGPTRAPTLAIWATPEGIANATKLLQAEPALRIFTTDESTAIVRSTLAPDERRAAMQRWLGKDDGPAWLVQDGDDEAWLLAGASTSLRSFSMAAAENLHVWWPGAPRPLSARVCGEELEVLAKTASQLAAVGFDDLLDDIAVWIPPARPQRRFDIDREAAARLGVSAYDVQRLVPLLVGEELVLREDLVVRVPLTATPALTVKANVGVAPISMLGTVLLDAEPAFITRFDNRRCIAVDLQPRRAEDRTRIAEILRTRIELPTGVYVTVPEQ